MKRVIVLNTFLIWTLLVSSVLAGTYSGGDGSAEYPYKIATPNDLNEIGDNLDDWNKNFVLTNDINMADYTYSTALIAPDTNNSNIEFDGIPFIGVFEGNDFCIRNFSIDAQGDGNDYLGLFGKTNPSAIIENLGFEDSNITGGYSYFLGGLCGRNYGTISNCYTTGAVSAQDDSGWIGGLCGLNYGTISNCYATSRSLLITQKILVAWQGIIMMALSSIATPPVLFPAKILTFWVASADGNMKA